MPDHTFGIKRWIWSIFVKEKAVQLLVLKRFLKASIYLQFLFWREVKQKKKNLEHCIGFRFQKAKATVSNTTPRGHRALHCFLQEAGSHGRTWIYPWVYGHSYMQHSSTSTAKVRMNCESHRFLLWSVRQLFYLCRTFKKHELTHRMWGTGLLLHHKGNQGHPLPSTS